MLTPTPTLKRADTAAAADRTGLDRSSRDARRASSARDTPRGRGAQTSHPANGAPANTADFYLAVHGSLRSWGGGRAVAVDLQRALQGAGWSTRMIGVAPPGSQPGESAPPVSNAAAGASVHRRPDHEAALDRGGVDLPVTTPRVLWRIQPWLVVGAMERALRRLPAPREAFVAVSPSWAAAAATAWPHTPVIFVFACSPANCLPFTWPDREPPSLWARLEKYALHRTDRAALRRAARVLAPSQQALDEVCAIEPGVRRRTTIYRDSFTPAPADAAARRRVRDELGVGDDDILFLAAGVCDANKSLDWLIRERPDNPHVHISIAGGGPELRRLRQLAADKSTRGRVHVLGPRDDVPALIAASDAVASTSWYDTFPGILKEALAAGRPVLVPHSRPPTTWNGFAELVEEDGCGLVYERAERGALREAMSRFAKDAALRVELMTAATAAAQRRSGFATLLATVNDVVETRRTRASRLR